MLGKEMIELLENTKNGCNHKCQECGLFIKNKCFYETKKDWQKWAKQQHKDFEKYKAERKTK